MASATAVNGLNHQPLPEVSDLDAGDGVPRQDLLQRVIDSLKVSGGCIVRNFISQETVKQLNDDFAPYFERAEPLKSTNCPPISRSYWSKRS